MSGKLKWHDESTLPQSHEGSMFGWRVQNWHSVTQFGLQNFVYNPLAAKKAMESDDGLSRKRKNTWTRRLALLLQWWTMVQKQIASTLREHDRLLKEYPLSLNKKVPSK